GNVVRAAGNAYLTALYEGVHTAVLSREHELWVRTETEPGWLAGSGASVLLEIHQAICDAVAAGDASRAQAAVLHHHKIMLEHLGDDGREDFGGGTGRDIGRYCVAIWPHLR